MSLLSIRFALFAANNECKTFRRANLLTCLIISVFNKIIIYATTPYFQ